MRQRNSDITDAESQLLLILRVPAPGRGKKQADGVILLCSEWMPSPSQPPGLQQPRPLTLILPTRETSAVPKAANHSPRCAAGHQPPFTPVTPSQASAMGAHQLRVCSGSPQAFPHPALS